MSSKLIGNLALVTPTKDDADYPYLMIVDTSAENTTRERVYTNIWQLAKKGEDVNAPAANAYTSYTKVGWSRFAEVSAMRGELEAQYDIYAISSRDPQTLTDRDEGITYRPFSINEQMTGEISNSMVVTYPKPTISEGGGASASKGEGNEPSSSSKPDAGVAPSPGQQPSGDDRPPVPPEAVDTDVPPPDSPQNDSLDTSLPTDERRTRAQLYRALVEAEKYGNRTIRKSSFETAIENVRPDDVAVEYFNTSIGTLSQGELVSLSASLMSRLRQLQREKVRNELRWRDEETALRQALQVETDRRAAASRANVMINIITEGVGYDS